MWASALKQAIEFVPFPSNLGASIRVLVEMVVNSPSLKIESPTMKRLTVSSLAACLLWFATAPLMQAQTHVHEGTSPCGLHQAQERLFALRPETRRLALEAQRALERETQLAQTAGQRDELLIIPIVFHVIHFNGPENISTAQVVDAVDVLNTNLRALNANIDEVIPEFEDVVADVEIEFRLAQRDPNGDCHPGINRIVSDLTYVGDSEMKSLIQWPRNKYLNVWVCEYAAGAAGYALYPGSVANNQNSDMDGIVLQHSYTGSIGTSTPYRSRTLTHEVGHWLNLRHTWGNSNNPGLAENCDEDDNVNDTPNTLGWTNCNLDGATCGSLDNVQNYMDYSYCGRMFTEGQKQRMRTAALSTTAQRNQLSTAANLEATGVAGEDILCEASFLTDRNIICVGDSILFTDQSYHGVTEWSWDFGDGATMTGVEGDGANEVYHTFESSGAFDISLTVGNATGEVSTTAEAAVYVMGGGELNLPLEQGFEPGEYPNSLWFVEDPLEDGSWEPTTAASYTGSRSMMVENWSNTVEFNDDFLRTATMDMSQADQIQIHYRWAYAFKGSNDDSETDDRLRVSVTGDCGNDWDLRRMHRGFTDLPSANPTPFPFVPSGAEDWNEYTIVLDQPQYLTENFRVQFEFESRLGNNIFLDDINITAVGDGINGLGELGSPSVWSLAPNPSQQSSSTLRFHLSRPSRCQAIVQDASGREVARHALSAASGSQEWNLPAPGVPGVYLLQLTSDLGLQRTWKWVVR